MAPNSYQVIGHRCKLESPQAERKLAPIISTDGVGCITRGRETALRNFIKNAEKVGASLEDVLDCD